MNPEILALSLLIGIATGLRAMTGIAIVSWAVHLGFIELKGSRLGFLGSLAAVALLTAAAGGEYIADKLPRTGRRTAAGPLLTRMLMGAACGAAFSVAAERGWVPGAVAGAGGAVLGSFGGYYARVGLVQKLRSADIYVALPEDLLAIGLAVLAVACL